jgi:hypothetical protein
MFRVNDAASVGQLNDEREPTLARLRGLASVAYLKARAHSDVRACSARADGSYVERAKD